MPFEPHPMDAPWFDATLGAWVLSRHADVVAALRAPALSDTSAGARAAHTAMQAAAARAFAPARLAAWRAEVEPAAHALAAGLATGEPVDLVRAFAEPWSLALACTVTGASPDTMARLAPLAREVFLAAACATDAGAGPDARAATAALARGLPATPMAVQAFVALSQTLPCLLAGAWHGLLAHPHEADRLRATPALVPPAVDELLRHGSPSRAVFRRAHAAVAIGDARIAAGERVILMLSAANDDPTRFPEPARLDLARPGAGHLALGRGTHACVGAPVIRMAVAVATGALLDATAAMEPAGDPTWSGGFAIRRLASLPVHLVPRA